MTIMSKMTHKTRLIVLGIIFTVLSQLTNYPIVHAQSGGQNGISITPPTQNITIEEDQASYRLTLIVANHTNSRVDLEMSAQDFGGLDDGGGLLFLGTSPNDKWEDHRLAKWMDIKPKNFKLEPQEQAEVVVEITNDDTLAPGGHYAAVMATVASKEEKQNVAINQSLSSLLFINKVGGETYSLEAEQIDPQTAWWGQVEGVTATLANTGNAHVVPRGTISLQDPLDHTVAQGIINRQSSILLPGTEDSFDISLEQTGLPLWPGMYTLVLAYRYDGQDALVTTQTRVLSLGVVASGVIILASTAGAAWLLKRTLPRLNRASSAES